MQRKLFSLACFFIWSALAAQQYPFVTYNAPKDELVNNRCRFIFQDSKGRLYISTFGGLSIYDGARFVNHTTDNRLIVNLINDIVEMGNDSLWLILNTNRLYGL